MVFLSLIGNTITKVEVTVPNQDGGTTRFNPQDMTLHQEVSEVHTHLAAAGELKAGSDTSLTVREGCCSSEPGGHRSQRAP